MKNEEQLKLNIQNKRKVKYKKDEINRWNNFYKKILKVEEVNNIVIYYQLVPYSISVIGIEIRQRTYLGKQLFKYLERVGLIKHW